MTSIFLMATLACHRNFIQLSVRMELYEIVWQEVLFSPKLLPLKELLSLGKLLVICDSILTEVCSKKWAVLLANNISKFDNKLLGITEK